MFEDVLATITAAAIIAVSAAAWRRGYLNPVVDAMLYRLAPSGARQHGLLPKDTPALRSNLVRQLLRDQSRFGNHRGEFGKSCDAIEAAKWQTHGARENLLLKPRMYLTYWPVLVLHEHGLVPRSVELATAGVKSLFIHGRIPVHTSAPGPSPMGHQYTWSNRHSMAGAHLLAVVDQGNTITRTVIDQMLDERNGWQDQSGGWWQTSAQSGAPDLWASVYALKLLDLALTGGIHGFEGQRDRVRSSIEKTFDHLTVELRNSGWGVAGKLLAEENLVSMYIDLAELFPRFCPELEQQAKRTMMDWLSPAHDLSRKYLEVLERQDPPTFPEQAYARMAYAFYLTDQTSSNWREWYERAARGSLQRLFSSELAFLLDMSYAIHDSGRQAGDLAIPVRPTVSAALVNVTPDNGR